MKKCIIIGILIFSMYSLHAQEPATPTIVDLIEDDRVATIYWNSKTATYHWEYDPDKRDGIYSYLVEWGPVNEGFIHQSVTPYRAMQAQPLDPDVVYQARISALDVYGKQSIPSDTITFQHDPSRVNDMRSRLNGFFDDMNLPMGPFDEKKWNQAYSGCMSIGYVSQHINQQYHGHNVLRSGFCDRGMAASRVREIFDFTDRTGVIEFDLDGAHMRRHFWYLDLTSADRKRDLSSHINSLGMPVDPRHFMRIEEAGSRINVYISDENGDLQRITDVYNNNACGESLEYCPGENLQTLMNVRRHWRIELSKINIKIFINGILVVDGDLITDTTPTGLTFEEAQVNWISFSYNTNKENLIMSMVHWDNFGFDAPAGFTKETVVHNYTDGKLGTETPRIGNEFSVGMRPTYDEEGIAIIPIPDPIQTITGNPPLNAELMFTLQGGHYNWNELDHILLNGNRYDFTEPVSDIPNFAGLLFSTSKPYPVTIEVDPNHLIQGENEIKFFLQQPRILNIHIELSYPIDEAPSYTPPHEVFADHHQKLMAFRTVADQVGPGVVINNVDDELFWTDAFVPVYEPAAGIKQWYVKDTPVSGMMPISFRVHSWPQLAAKGSAKGISYIEMLMDSQVVKTIRTDIDHPVAALYLEDSIDTRQFDNGLHELFIRAYDAEGNPSLLDRSSAHSTPGDYMPIIIDIANLSTSVEEEISNDPLQVYPNPSRGYYTIVGEVEDYRIEILSTDGRSVHNLGIKFNEPRIDIRHLPNGIYFMQAVHRSNGKRMLSKLIKH